ncbi:MAG: NAD(P)/FAD-dependent oxidoreductase [Thermoleophilia bacterium]|nr:NAD(P)/FAD-dependent oxidoreductase [Thermoleophilia bacterium]
MSSDHYPRLFEPGSIGKLKLRNRVVMAPMGTGYGDPDGNYSQRDIDYFVARAKGGTSLLFTGVNIINRKVDLPAITAIHYLDSNSYISRASDLVEAVHDYGAKICIQIGAGFGRQAEEVTEQRIPVAPSPVPASGNPSIICRELSKQEVKHIVELHSEAARRAAVAGFDMIEFHGHTGYLMDQFMTPAWNRRTDEYGGDLDGRLRFPLESIAAVRRVVGPGFPLSFRLSVEHKTADGRTRAEGIEIAQRLEAAGIDVLHVDGGCYDAMPWVFPPVYHQQGPLVELAAAVKEAVSIPVITVGGIRDPEFAEKILEQSRADFVALGRELIADPEWANKASWGHAEDIRPCVFCNERCIGGRFSYKAVGCTVNATAGKERHYALNRPEKQKKVVVIGGGPGGMEAARVAAARGHDVTLYEKESILGGQLVAGSQPGFKSVFRDLIGYYSTQLGKLGVKIECGCEITPELADGLEADVVVVATGAVPGTCPIPGSDNRNVVHAADLLLGKKEAGRKIVMVGGGLTGCDTALWLALKGNEVTIIEMMPAVAMDMNCINRVELLHQLHRAGVKVCTNLTVRKRNPSGVVIEGDDGGDETITADTIVLALGSKSRNELANSIGVKPSATYVIGDCVSPRKVGYAIHEGFVAGWRA